MTKQTTIYLVRHGQSELNEQGIISGHVDPNLTEQGKEQVRQARLALKNVHFDTAYSSDLKRAIHTAEILYGKPVAKTNRIHELRERNFGALDGKPEYLLKEGNAKKLDMTHEEGWVFKHVPDMESDHELSTRFLMALEKVAKNNQGKTVLVVAHGGAIRTTIMALNDYTYEELPAGSFKNAGYAELTYDQAKGFKVIQISGVRL